MEYLSDARRVPFGVEPIIGYLYARETEATIIRIIMAGRMAGLDRETIRSACAGLTRKEVEQIWQVTASPFWATGKAF